MMSDNDSYLITGLTWYCLFIPKNKSILSAYFHILNARLSEQQLVKV